jgi:molybdate transport system substrate-binding protein
MKAESPQRNQSTNLSVFPSSCFLSLSLFILLVTGCHKEAPSPQPLRIAAAADLAFAFKDIGEAFEKKTGRKVTFSFGSTGLLAKQITEGAPFDIFAAANESFVDDVVKSGACLGDSKELYATGRVVMWTKKGAEHKPAALSDLSRAEFAKIAIANPDHAPYGRAAKQAMQKAGVWDAVSSRVVYGENVQQTLQFAQTGNAEVSIVALSLATVSDGDYVVIDPAMHDRLDQAMVVCKGAPGTRLTAVGRDFERFVSSEEGRGVMRRYGFLLPGESPPQAGK